MFLENCQDLITIENGEPVTTSIIVADTFGKRHTHVIQKIGELISQIEESQKVGSPNLFEKTEYITSQNKPQPMYYLNRDGFTLLAMGFTGQTALEWKLKYIAAFNAMEKKLHPSGSSLSDGRSDVAKFIVKATRPQIQAIKELYPEYFSPVPIGSPIEKIVNENTSYAKWLEDFGITSEWIGNFPTTEIYHIYAQYCVEHLYNPLGKKTFFDRLAYDFGLIRKQKKDGYRYFLVG